MQVNWIRHKHFLSFLVFFIFFLTGLFTVSDYGISWDEPTHFKRGQGYLRYMLTGEKDYGKLPKYDLERAKKDTSYHERSIYQDDMHNAAFYMSIDGSHPPLNGIMASLSNMVFYQKLGVMDDVESYHLFEIFVASLGMVFVFLMLYESFGFFAALMSAVFLGTYPLFFSESHFNIKDPVETGWFAGCIYFLWKGFSGKSIKSLVFSAIFAGFALGTKLNIMFLPFMFLPWVLLIFKDYRKDFVAFVKKPLFIFILLLYPAIVFSIFYFTYPFLWEDPIGNILKVINYYQTIGIDIGNLYSLADRFYAIKWIVFTTPPLMLFACSFFLLYSKNLWGKHYHLVFLVILWFLVPIIRVSIPGGNIYGGVRQIMEYIPAMAIIAGIGIDQFRITVSNFFNRSRMKAGYVGIFLAISAIFILIYPLIKLHPNQNVYFNFLVDGLSGAYSSGLPSAGNSFGNAYRIGVDWVNKNAPTGAKLSLIQGTTVNIPEYWVREDIQFSNDHWSGIERGGEYLMELTFNYESKAYHYAWDYVNKILIPVFELKVDDSAILKIWKNDLLHTRPEYIRKEREYKDFVVETSGETIILILKDEMEITRLFFKYPKEGCEALQDEYIETSVDNVNWKREFDGIPFTQVLGKLNASEGSTMYFLAAKNAKYIRYHAGKNSCMLLLEDAKITILEN